MLINILCVLALLLCGIAHPALSVDTHEIPLDLQAKLLLTALAYNNNLDPEDDKVVEIGILAFPTNPHSREEADMFFKMLDGFQDKQVAGLDFTVTIFAYNDISTLRKDVADKKIEVLYLVCGDTQTTKDIVELTRAKKIISVSSITAQVSLCGVTMSIGLKDNKPKIYINLPAAHLEGADFSAKLLRIAEVQGENTAAEPNR